MTSELVKDGQTDGRYKYYADGVLRVNNLEVLIMEASSAYDKATDIKSAFDHYKGMFGALSIMTHIASKYKYASFNIFKLLKIHFVHAHGKKKYNNSLVNNFKAVVLILTPLIVTIVSP